MHSQIQWDGYFPCNGYFSISTFELLSIPMLRLRIAHEMCYLHDWNSKTVFKSIFPLSRAFTFPWPFLCLHFHSIYVYCGPVLIELNKYWRLYRRILRISINPANFPNTFHDHNKKSLNCPRMHTKQMWMLWPVVHANIFYDIDAIFSVTHR